MKTRDSAAIRLDTGALREVGVEHLSVNNVTTAAAASVNPRAHVFWFQRVKDAFVRDVGTYASALAAVQTSHLQSGGIYLVTSKRITVTGCAMEHAQNHGDGGAGYAFEASMCSNEDPLLGQRGLRRAPRLHAELGFRRERPGLPALQRA